MRPWLPVSSNPAESIWSVPARLPLLQHPPGLLLLLHLAPLTTALPLPTLAHPMLLALPTLHLRAPAPPLQLPTLS